MIILNRNECGKEWGRGALCGYGIRLSDIHAPDFHGVMGLWCGASLQDTCMSFAVSLDEGAIEWSSDNVRTLKGKRYVQV